MAGFSERSSAGNRGFSPSAAPFQSPSAANAHHRPGPTSGLPTANNEAALAMLGTEWPTGGGR